MSYPNKSGSNAIPLGGVMNFREVGRLKGDGGKHVKPGMLWRSAGLDRPHAKDLDAIKSLSIQTVVDLRGPDERAAFPTHIALTESWDTLWSAPEVGDVQADAFGLLTQSRDKDVLTAAISKLYTQIADQHATHIRMAFDAIASNRVPILIHCAAGKDRTGVVVALVLESLGVDRRDIMANYLETNAHLDWERLSVAATAGTGVGDNRLDLITQPALALLKSAQPEFLQAALTDIDARYQSIDAFLTRKAGIPAETIAQVRESLLE